MNDKLEGNFEVELTTKTPKNEELLHSELSSSDEETNKVDIPGGVSVYEHTAEELARESVDVRKAEKDQDVEKANGNEDDFDLRKYFENSARMQYENGGKPKRMGVTVRNLTVIGNGASTSVIQDMFTPVVWFANLFNPWSWVKKKHRPDTTFEILHDVNFFCKDGEMVLVLGRPGAGCSTLLRVISNQRKSYVDVKGEVSYGGIPAEDFKRFRGEAIYTPEEEAHYPILTVWETLNFALKCKTPGNRLPDETKRTFREKIFDLLVSMYGLSKQRDTLVGNEWVRGLSGGERKRLTISEAMISSSSINCWDCSTRGLDAASALDYAKSLRIMSDTLHKTTVASFYQASDNIYNLFDKVMVLEKGRCIYFGPTKDAKQYFLDLGFDCEPRKSTPDFLTGVTNPQERIVKPEFEGKIPETSYEFEAIWNKSKIRQQALEEQAAYEKEIEKEQPQKEFREEIKDQKGKGVRKKSPYTTNFFTQVLALTMRHFQLIWRDKFSIFSRYFSVVTQSLIYGSVFLNMPTDATGVFNRGGAIFSAILFNAFLSQAELPNSFYGRRILQKHNSYAMYHPAAFHIAQVVTDIPIVLIQVFVFSIIAYFMFGLDPDAGKFFIFVFTLVGSALMCTNLFRLFGNTTPSLYIAQHAITVFLIFMISYCGYLIPREKMHPWFAWFYWIDPLSYAFKALMANEFSDITFDCNNSAIPAGPSYTDSLYRTCPITGSQPGSLQVPGSTYLRRGLEIKVSEMALDIIVVYLFWIFFTLCNMAAMEWLDFTGGGYTHKVYKRGKGPKALDEAAEREQMKIVKEATDKMEETLKMKGGVFTWKDVRYTVPVKEGKRLLLEDVEGWIKPGQMTALMGASGAGKTTLLDVLAKRKTVGEVSGEVRLNGQPLRIDFERITGYVEQMDVHNPGLTVRETLRFSAKLRQDPSVSREEKFQYVEDVLKMMEMSHLGDALVGDLESGVGISVEERKRLTIGVELVAKPEILFLDEPTSGLDAQSSYNIVKFIRKLADAGMPLVCTIHQPSSVLFEHFDRLLLLARGGKTVYFGDIGEKSRILAGYFERHGVRKCTENENPAEYILEAIGAGVNGKTDVDWPAAWKSSKEFQAVNEELTKLESEHDDSRDNEKPREFATSQWYQFTQVYKKLNLVWWRDPYYSFGRFFQAVLVGLVNGFSYWNLGNSTSDMTLRIMTVFQTLILGIMLIFLALPQVFIQREYFRRDYASKFYSWAPFAVSIVLVELPYLTIAGTLCVVCVYWTAGLDSTPINGFYFWIMFIMFMFFCVSFGQAIAAICLNVMIAMIVLPLLVVFLFLFCGVLAPPSTLPRFWESWMYPLDPCHYFLEGIVTDVLKEVRVHCTSDDLLRFNAPAGTTCGEYAAEFMKTATGYIDNPDATSNCGYCTYSNGADYYNTLEWSYDHRWRNFGILAAFWIFNIGLVCLFIFLTKKGRR